MEVSIKKYLNKSVVIDTSLLIKFFIEEEGSELVKKLVQAHRRHQLSLLATPLIFFECINSLSKILKDADKVKAAATKLKEFELGVIDFWRFDNRKAIEVSCKTQVSFYDASYHALAADLQGTFITADKKYFNQVKGQGYIELLLFS